MADILKLNRSESKLTQFVQRAASDDIARPILNGINVNKELVVAADGWRFHTTQISSVPALTMDEEKTLNLGKVRNGENLLEPEEIPGRFPDTTQLIPAGDPIVRFAVDPKFLVDACKTLDKGMPVCITVYSELNPIELQGVIDEQPVYALIMPMHLDGHGCPDLNWKPNKGKPQSLETEKE